jgi:4-hydroxy-tetrahydrodipicolinate reductase
MSYGISALKLLIGRARTHLSDFDVEIVETHHRGKRDLPSGTAIALSRVLSPDSGHVIGREVTTARKDAGDALSAVPVHSVRAGGVPGEHRVIFASDDEVVELSHRALSREVFARGAIRAARFVTGRPPGLISMKELLESQHA